MARRTRRRLVVPVVLSTLALITGCGKIPGTPTAAEIDVRPLDVGTYSTQPLDFRYQYGHTLYDGVRLAAMRLADNMVIGTEIDADYRYLLGSSPLLDRNDVEKVLADVNGPVIERNNMVVGFGVTLGNNEDGEAPEATTTTLAVLQFPDEATAERAAREIEQTDFDVAADQNVRVSIPNIPEALAHWRPGIASLGAYQAHGAYVMTVYVETPEAELEILADNARRALENQARLLDALPPLTGEGILRLEYDPDRMLERTLNPEGRGAPSFLSQATFTRRGMFSQLNSQAERGQILDKAGVDRYAMTSQTTTTLLFRTRDADAALGLGADVLSWGYEEPIESPPGIPGVRCGSLTSEAQATRYRCTVPYQRYLAAVESDQLIDLHQRAAAQYALLANTY